MTVDLVTAVNALIRDVIREVADMEDGSVRPAQQRLGVGKHGEEFATVNVLTVETLSTPVRSYLDDPTTGSEDVIERIDAPLRFAVSINFFRSPDVDAAGLASYGCNAFARATRLRQLFESSAGVELLRGYGLGLGRVGQARNLTALIDGGWESRGQVDVDFMIINRESFLLATYAKTATITTKAQMGQTERTFTATTTAEETP